MNVVIVLDKLYSLLPSNKVCIGTIISHCLGVRENKVVKRTITSICAWV